MIITAGAIEGITATLLTILERDDEVLIPSPTYVSYSEAIKVAGGIPISVPLDEEKSWSINTNYFKEKITPRTKAIFFCNPNNPTSTIYSKQEVQELEELAKEFNLFIITDEVYKDFIYEDIEYYSPAQNPEIKDRVVRIFSFSKAFAMTGWRIGFVHSSKENIAEIIKVHDAIVTCAPVVSQYAAIAAFELAEEEVLRFKREFIKRRDLILRRLDKLSNYFSYKRPNSAYFVFPKILKECSSRDIALDLLYKAKVATVSGIAFGPTGENHIRISFGVTEEKINEAFDRIEQYFKEQQ
ncbi:aminotransferase [bacterium CG06_land_8_20_14_3_00_33_50]|nr:MAG: aminotransferase [bacterium CG10_big_fil_rev_8_21_14_0_10_33_18]PIU77038.1 MAG: aminotransferase [bacterium CG06_land_8_20_14_3_00_33_50]PIW81385.1 MAG: aminotransferase [bacterium CG_4_8_14_3_um_filter_33_28]